ncbi:MAG TPA: beta-mannosidase [Prolixibacteraceae bacterium]|nr:beta-mannosidase [Prolixibacteraceae bacterium]HCU63126.1 beta-mannosidase [Prolixibacteraceae bacterium]
MKLYFSIYLLFIAMLTMALDKEKSLETPYYIFPRQGTQHIDLSTDWQLSCTDTELTDVGKLPGKSLVSVQYPTTVHTALYKAGVLPNPYANLNSIQYRWVEEKVWYYQKSVVIPVSAKGKLVFLNFDGVDYFSKVWINGNLLGTHEGMFGGPTIEISKYAKYDEKNEIVLEVKAGNWGNRATNFEDLPRTSTGDRDYSKRTGYNPWASGKIIKPWIISGGLGTEAFFSVGMWQGARIEIVPTFHIERPFLKTLSANTEKAVIHLSSEIFTSKNSLQLQLHPWNRAQMNHPNEKGNSYIPVNENLHVQIEFLSGNTVAFSKEFPLKLYEGRNWLEQDIVISNPKLWNPVGLGKPDLYRVQLSLFREDEKIDQVEFDYGIRTIERIASAGPRTFDRWENWQFIANGKKIFIKGMNWTPIDVLLDMPEERYRWTLEAAKNMGVQLIRVWGGGLLEKDCFYDICNELGIMVWQDFPIGNQDTPEFPQEIWEAQVVQNIFRLRNHPSLVVWCGGNEFNPYSYGNATSIGILERNLNIFDNTRLFVRTTPDDGSVHVYPDMDPCWYNRSYKYEAWMSETGMHSIPDASLFYELVDNKEFFDLGKMWDNDFYKKHPEFIHHFTEYGPGRVPRMLSRASHIDSMANPTIESISEASQIGAGEWYQIVSEKMQGNYPVTTGLMPWVFKRQWPVIAIQMMDWFGQPVAPYYFLKRTYEKTHVAIDLQRLLWGTEEGIGLVSKVTHAGNDAIFGTVTVTVYDDKFKVLLMQVKDTEINQGPSVTQSDFGEFKIPASYKNRYLFIIAELKGRHGELISRSIYFPRVLEQMENKEFHDKSVNEPIPWITLDKGPWLKPTVAGTSTKLRVELIGNQFVSSDRDQLKVRISNTGEIPAFMTKIDITGIKRIFYSSDNYFWLAPGESKEISLNVLWRELRKNRNIILEAEAWNSRKQSIKLDSQIMETQKL